MTKQEIHLNNFYLCKISGKICKVKITSVDQVRNRYSVLNLQTNRTIVLGSAARLRKMEDK